MASVRRSARSTRHGFTLIEAMVALSLAGLLLTGASAVLSAITQASERAGEQSDVTNHEANAERALRSLVLSYEPTADSAASFGGDERRAWFDTWCAVPSGWLESCSAMLTVDSVAGRRSVVAVLSTGGAIVVKTGFRDAQLMYLRDAANGGVWVSRWPPSLTSPLAIGIVTDRDTTILRIGERR